MFGLGVPEIVLILIIALVIFGPSKLPEIGKAFGKSISEFKKGAAEITKEVNESVNTESPKKES